MQSWLDEPTESFIFLLIRLEKGDDLKYRHCTLLWLDTLSFFSFLFFVCLIFVLFYFILYLSTEFLLFSFPEDIHRD